MINILNQEGTYRPKASAVM